MANPETLANYDPAAVVASFGDIDIQGYADGTFLEVEHEEDSFTKKVGSTGAATRVMNRNRSGKITITLMHAAPTNDLLMAKYREDRATGLAYKAFQVKDLHGNMRCKAAECWIMKAPKIERAKDAVHTVWVFECANLDIDAGGNLV